MYLLNVAPFPEYLNVSLNTCWHTEIKLFIAAERTERSQRAVELAMSITCDRIMITLHDNWRLPKLHTVMAMSSVIVRLINQCTYRHSALEPQWVAHPPLPNRPNNEPIARFNMSRTLFMTFSATNNARSMLYKSLFYINQRDWYGDVIWC